MWKRALWILWLLALGIMPAAAQDAFDPLALIPADFAGFVRLQVRDGDTLSALNVASFAASYLQPQRAQYQPLQGLEDVIPLAQFDVEDVSFAQDISPWLNGEIVVAYQTFGPGLQAGVEDRVLILPTADVLQSASSFSRILNQQDVLQQDTYRGATLYMADKTTIVFTPHTVLAGPTALVKTLLDVQAGDHERLIDSEAYLTATANRPQNAVVSGYLAGEEVLRALSVLLEGDESAVPILENLSQALRAYREDASLEQLVLGNALDGVAFHLQADTLRLNSVRVNLTLYDAEHTAPVVETRFNTDLLNLLPQNAMVVHSGTDAPGAVYDFLTALPLANFAGQVVGAFPIPPSATATAPALDVPDASHMTQAIDGLLTALRQQRDFDLEDDLLQHLGGSYSLALLPRPNDPLLPLNLLYDVLIVAETDDAAAAQAGAQQLAEALLALDRLEAHIVDDLEFQAVMIDGEPVLQIGVVDDLLVVATGEALEQALDARRGDDRLITRERWQEVSGDSVPQLYVDIPAIYSTFLPQLAGPQLQLIRQLSARTEYLGDGVFQVRLLVTLPSQLG